MQNKYPMYAWQNPIFVWVEYRLNGTHEIEISSHEISSFIYIVGLAYLRVEFVRGWACVAFLHPFIFSHSGIFDFHQKLPRSAAAMVHPTSSKKHPSQWIPWWADISLITLIIYNGQLLHYVKIHLTLLQFIIYYALFVMNEDQTLPNKH